MIKFTSILALLWLGFLTVYTLTLVGTTGDCKPVTLLNAIIYLGMLYSVLMVGYAIGTESKEIK